MFYCDRDFIRDYLQSCHLLETNDDSSIYKDVADQVWRHLVFWSAMLEKDIEVLEAYPPMPIADLIKLLIESDSPETVAALSISMAQRGFDNDIKNRQLLVDLLEKELANRPDKLDNIKLCIYESELFDATNRAEIIGKDIAQIDEDATSYRSIAKRAKAILEYSG
jgi:hypothetical protein